MTVFSKLLFVCLLVLASVTQGQDSEGSDGFHFHFKFGEPLQILTSPGRALTSLYGDVSNPRESIQQYQYIEGQSNQKFTFEQGSTANADRSAVKILDHESRCISYAGMVDDGYEDKGLVELREDCEDAGLSAEWIARYDERQRMSFESVVARGMCLDLTQAQLGMDGGLLKVFKVCMQLCVMCTCVCVCVCVYVCVCSVT